MDILVAEDDLLSQSVLCSFLKELGHKVVAVKDGLAAWEAIKTQKVQVIISDWLMPNLDGIELCKKVRAQNKEDYIYFILLTSVSNSKERYLEAMRCGVDDFMKKPFDQEEILIRLRVARRIIEHTQRIKNLEEMVTICAYTKKVQLPDESWQDIELFIERNLGIKLSHGINPDYYAQTLKPQIERMKQKYKSSTSSEK